MGPPLATRMAWCSGGPGGLSRGALRWAMLVPFVEGTVSFATVKNSVLLRGTATEGFGFSFSEPYSPHSRRMCLPRGYACRGECARQNRHQIGHPVSFLEKVDMYGPETQQYTPSVFIVNSGGVD